MAMDSHPHEPVFMDATLRPNPPLSPRAAFFLLVAVGAINFAFGIVFALHGAWPIAPFMGADVALLAWSFRAARRAARRHEHITLTETELHITRWPSRGPPTEISLNPYWLRVSLEADVEPARKLFVSSHGRSIEIGAFLAPRDREAFAEALRHALRAAKEFRPV
jgi:uncharacterized membrane protein